MGVTCLTKRLKERKRGREWHTLNKKRIKFFKNGQQYAAEIEIHPSGKFLFASTRGSGELVIYQIQDDHNLKFVQVKNNILTCMMETSCWLKGGSTCCGNHTRATKGWFTRAAFDVCGYSRRLRFCWDRKFYIFPHCSLLPRLHVWLSLKVGRNGDLIKTKFWWSLHFH